MSYQQPHKTIYLTHLKCFLEAQFHMILPVTDTYVTDIHEKCTSVTAIFPDSHIRGTKGWCMLVTHTMLI